MLVGASSVVSANAVYHAIVTRISALPIAPEALLPEG